MVNKYLIYLDKHICSYNIHPLLFFASSTSKFRQKKAERQKKKCCKKKGSSNFYCKFLLNNIKIFAMHRTAVKCFYMHCTKMCLQKMRLRLLIDTENPIWSIGENLRSVETNCSAAKSINNSLSTRTPQQHEQTPSPSLESFYEICQFSAKNSFSVKITLVFKVIL